MASKELMDLAAKAMEERRKELIAQPLSRIYPQLAEAAISNILSSIADLLDHKAEAARKHAKAFHDKRKSGKYGLKKQTRFYEEGKHYNRLAIGYAKSARAIRALGGQSE